MSEFLNLVQNRRSIYGISNESTLSDSKLKELIETAIKHTPSAYNSQTSRVILLLGDESKKLWDIVLNTLKQRVKPENFKPTEKKIGSFAAGYGTILYFEEQDVIEKLQNDFPSYADNFPVWSLQSAGMLQFVVWTALENEGLGASLQHYNPIIDDEVHATWDIPKSWKLLAQMPFGKPTGAAGEKQFIPIENRFKVFGN